MAPNRSRRPYRTSGARVSPSWVYLQTLVAPLAASSKLLIGGFVPSTASIEETILRTRIELFVVSDQNAVPEFQQGAFGMYVVSDLAFAAGIASIPSPVAQGSDDGWFVHQTFIQMSDQISGGGNYGSRWSIDSKAMRKIPEGATVAIVIENSSLFNAFQFAVGVRMLSKITQG